MYENANKTRSALPKEKSIVKLIKIGTSMNLEEENESLKSSVSDISGRRSVMTKASKISGREERRRVETDLIDKIYASMLANQTCDKALQNLISTAKDNGEEIEPFQQSSIKEMLEMVDIYLFRITSSCLRSSTTLLTSMTIQKLKRNSKVSSERPV